MPRNLHKSLSDYLSKIKKQIPHLHTTTSKIFSFSGGCSHRSRQRQYQNQHQNEVPASNHDDQHHQNDEASAATLADIDRFLVENFKSLYGNNSNNNNNFNSDSDNEAGVKNNAGIGKDHHLPAKILFDSLQFSNQPPDLCGSHRFFISSGGSSRSCMDDVQTSGEDSTTTTTTTTSTTAATAINNNVEGVGMKEVMPAVAGQDCIALLTASPNPYEDFRRSMKEMTEARLRQNQAVDWDFIEELLFSYLRLNEKKQYKYILGAFVDLIMILRQNSSDSSGGPTEIGGSGGYRYIKEREKGKEF
ncbi:hypothetical protein Ancab_012126 [Ancistrocladus abbreviatus]